MRLLRSVAALLLVGASALAAFRLVIPRYRCNRDKAIANSSTTNLRRNLTGYERTDAARKVAEMCRRCLERFPNDYELYTLLATNEETLGDFDRASQSYRRSIALNARPESYAYLAMMQLERGNPEEARKNLYFAALFNLSVVELVDDPLRSEVANAVLARHARLGSGDKTDQWRERRRRNANRAAPAR